MFMKDDSYSLISYSTKSSAFVLLVERDMPVCTSQTTSKVFYSIRLDEVVLQTNPSKCVTLKMIHPRSIQDLGVKL